MRAGIRDWRTACDLGGSDSGRQHHDSGVRWRTSIVDGSDDSDKVGELPSVLLGQRDWLHVGRAEIQLSSL